MIVGSIETVWAGTISPPHYRMVNAWDYEFIEQAIELEKGGELGRFKLGSTVIILFAKDMLEWNNKLVNNTDIRMGQEIGVHYAK